jgi:hypothetical protein
MSTDDKSYEAVLQIVITWPAAKRYDLMQALLQTLAPASVPDQPRGKMIQQLEGRVVTDLRPQADMEVTHWVEDQRR